MLRIDGRRQNLKTFGTKYMSNVQYAKIFDAKTLI